MFYLQLQLFFFSVISILLTYIIKLLIAEYFILIDKRQHDPVTDDRALQMTEKETTFTHIKMKH